MIAQSSEPMFSFCTPYCTQYYPPDKKQEHSNEKSSVAIDTLPGLLMLYCVHCTKCRVYTDCTALPSSHGGKAALYTAAVAVY